MSKLYVMVGPAGSGKSTYVCENMDDLYDAWVSTDGLRRQLLGDASDQSKNGLVFQIAHEHICSLLKEGDNVWFDATNLTRRDRNSLYKAVEGIDCKIVIVIMETCKELCTRRDAMRERHVGTRVIEKHFQKLENEDFSMIRNEDPRICEVRYIYPDWL